MVNTIDSDLSLLNIDKVTLGDDELTMYDVKYFKNLNRLNTLYLSLVYNSLDGVFQKSGKGKCLILSSTEKNRIMLENYVELFGEIVKQIQLIDDEKVKYTKYIMKIKFKPDDDLPFGEMINMPVFVVVISSTFKEHNEYHPQISRWDRFYEHEGHGENVSPTDM